MIINGEQSVQPFKNESLKKFKKNPQNFNKRKSPLAVLKPAALVRYNQIKEFQTSTQTKSQDKFLDIS